MYRSEEHQISFFDFNQSCGMQLNKDNEWVKLAGQIDWHRLEETYADMFPSKKGIPDIFTVKYKVSYGLHASA